MAARDALRAAPAVARWLAAAVEPVRRAGSEGYAPSAAERRRLGFLAAAALLFAGTWMLGPAPAAPLAAAGPAAASWALASRATRYRRAVESALPRIATAIADALAAGRSARAALDGAASSLEGPAAVEMLRVRADLDLGCAPRARPRRACATGSGRRGSIRSARCSSRSASRAATWSRCCAATPPRRRAASGRRPTRARRPRRRASPDCWSRRCPPAPRSSPSCSRRASSRACSRNGASLALLAAAGALQLAGFAAIRRLSRVGPA